MEYSKDAATGTQRMQAKPLVLVILDGWGCREPASDNAIAQARTPVWHHLLADYPHTVIHTSGAAVGLPNSQMGNSEVGHMNLGAGRVVYQEFTRISKAIEDGSFFSNEVLCNAVDKAAGVDGAVHVMGLLSPGGVHSHEQHLFATVELAVRRGAKDVVVHAILDGRDTPPRSAQASLERLQATLERLQCGRIASLVGRYYAMDRDQRWDRTAAAYRLISQGAAEYRASDALAGLRQAYERGESDEFVKPTAIVTTSQPSAEVADGDSVIFINFRADRARQLSRAFTEDRFDGFDRGHRPRLGAFVCMTQYQDTIPAPVAFPPVELHNGLGELLAAHHLRQLRLAETEKYAHVTFFFNGGRESPFPGEERVLVPSPKVATYDQQPQMSAPEVTDKLVEALRGGRFDVIICNYANPDMVGHTGIFEAAVTAVEAIDQCLGRLLDALHAAGAELLITADHGNVEQMRDERTGQAHTAHTTNPVPLIYVGRPATLAPDGALCDIAPTMLTLLGLPQPKEMTGRSLVRLESTGN